MVALMGGAPGARAGYDRNRAEQVIDYTNPAPEEVVERYVDGRYVDYSTPVDEDSPAYDRCKTTHRCARAYNHFDSAQGSYLFTKRVFPNGLHEPAAMFTDFEGYEPGTTGWDVDPAYLSRRHPTVQFDAAHFDPFALASYPPLYVNVSSTIEFNTDTAVATYFSAEGINAPPPFLRDAGNNALGTLTGEVALTASGLTEVAVFNFDSLYIGARVNVTLVGNRAIALTSRSSNYIDTHLMAKPGRIGGFLGDLLPSNTSRWGNNDNGPGSGSLRVYLQTVTTSATNVDEVQQITTTAQTGQTIRGTFTLEYKGSRTHPIPVNAEPELMRERIEEGLPLAGTVAVTRSKPDLEQGYRWNVTFVSTPGDVPQLIAHSQLSGLEASVRTDTLIDGNTIRGTFTMSFGGAETRPLRPGSSTLDVQEALEELPEVVTAHVVRNDPTSTASACEGGVCEGGMDNKPVSWGQCEHGLCANGPLPAWGFEWQITITTNMGVVVPGSPTSPLFWETTDPEPLAVNGSKLEGINATVDVVLFQEVDRPNSLPPHNFSHYSPFNLAFGGAGASYGGIGGLGHARHAPPPTYLDDTLPDLQGGSGGAVGGELPQQALAHESPSGRGGDGGGAIEILAYSDVIIGKNGGIQVDGQDGRPGYRGGGGGSGGAVHIVAGGVVVIHSRISANGGKGGQGVGKGSRGGGGGSGGRIAIYGQSVTVTEETGGFLDVEGGAGGLDGVVSGDHNSVLSLLGVDAFSGFERTPENTKGHVGSIRRTTAGGSQYRIDLDVGGAADTQRCMRVDVSESTETDSAVNTSSPFAMNGPSFSLRADTNGLWAVRRTFGNMSGVDESVYTSRGARPELVQFYVRLGRMQAGSAPDNWLAHIALHEFDEYTTDNLDDDGNVIPGLSAYPDNIGETGNQGADGAALIGVAVVDGSWRYDSNYRHVPAGRTDQPQQHVFARNAAANQWYKVDIFIDWDKKEYLIRLDDIMRVRRVKFIGEAIRRIGFYSFHGSTIYIDEVYAGPADTMGFECPESQEGVRPIIDRPIQHSWKVEDYGQETYNWEVVRHDSHMSRRRAYNEGDYGGMVFYDGEPHRFYHSDIMTKTPDGDRKQIVGSLHAGNMVYLPGDGPSDWAIDASATIARAFKEWGSRRADDKRGDAGRFFWFAEHDDPRWVAGGRDPNGSVPVHYSGGVMACSTTDLIRWKNEGTMFHFTNITDDEHHTTDLMRAERPKTIYNNLTQTYVMWMHADNLAVSLRLAGIAQGGYVNGPYVMYRTRLPDGNETTDLTLFRDEDGTAHLARTYYASVPYYMPEPVMQPLWESVKNPDGTINYPLNYHRAFYHASYDNPDDIYQQRWRYEDQPWRIETHTEEGLWVEVYDHDSRLFILENVDRLAEVDAENERRRLNNQTLIELDIGFDEELQSTGLYLNLTVAVPLECDPLTCTVMGYSSAPEHRAEVMDAVLGVAATRNIIGQGQPPVQTRYKDPTDPNNNLWSPSSVPAVKTQNWGANYNDKNIADNPPHTTPPDLLIGLPHIVEWRRAKYLALSRLTDDYLDTNGEIEILEGEMEDEGFLMMVLNDYGKFGWSSGDKVRHTYPEDVYSSKAPFNFDTESDWHDRLHQFYESENDRADDFVNFRDKRTNFDDKLTDLCPRKHQTCQDKYATCQVIWAEQVLLPEAPQLSATFDMKSYSIAQPTLEYETCLAEHRQCLEEYQHCIQTRIPRDRG